MNVLARRLWPLTVRVLACTPAEAWPEVALLLRPFIERPGPATFLVTHRLLSAEARRRSWLRMLTRRYQQELEVVQAAVREQPRWAELLGPLLGGVAEDSKAAARLQTLFLLLQTREMAEAKAEASIAAMKDRLLSERASVERRTRPSA